MPLTVNLDRDHFEGATVAHFKLYPSSKKFESPANIKTIVDRMLTYGLTVPSFTMVSRAISELVKEGKITRADGGNEATDRIAAAKAKQARIEQLASAPLTAKDWEEFSQMSPADVAKQFYSDPVFAARYRKASQLWGFLIPEKPASQSLPASPGQWSGLTAKAYNLLPVADVVRNYRSDPSFKQAVDKLIAEGRI